MKKKMIWILGVLLLTGIVNGYSAETAYPTRPIELVVPAGPGGITDLTARVCCRVCQQ